VRSVASYVLLCAQLPADPQGKLLRDGRHINPSFG
jgi:hypothetical protein